MSLPPFICTITNRRPAIEGGSAIDDGVVVVTDAPRPAPASSPRGLSSHAARPTTATPAAPAPRRTN